MTEDEKIHIPHFLQFKSNLRFSNLFEDIDYDDYRTHYNYRALSRKTLTLDAPQNSNLDFLKDTTPRAYLSFHIGPYRAVPKMLLENGVNLVLLIDEAVFSKQKEEMKDIHQSMDDTSKKKGDLIILSVHDRSSILKVKGLIDKGYAVFIYLDGNTGQEVTLNEKNSEEIDFYDMKFNIRNGVVKLIHLFKLEPILLINYWENKSVNLKKLQLNKDSLLQDAYTFLQDTMNTKERILQWECWLYCQKWISSNSKSNNFTSTQVLNPLEYELLQLDSNYFLFRLKDLQTFQISSEEYNFLNQARKMKINQFRKMIGEGILTV